MKTKDVRPSTYVDFDVQNNYKDPKCKVDDHVRIYQNTEVFLQRVTSQIGLSFL